MTTYVFDEADERELGRLQQLDAHFRHLTTTRLAALGAVPGRRCMDVGAGAGGVASFLAEAVGPAGSVVAADINPRFLGHLDQPNVEVRRLDVRTDELGKDEFDLIHARCLLDHLPERLDVLDRLVAALAPGGRILISSLDMSPAAIEFSARYLRPASAAAAYRRGYAAVATLIGASGGDPEFGTKAYGALLDAGLADVGATVDAPLVAPGGTKDWMRVTMENLDAPIRKLGLMTDDELKAIFALSEDPDCRYVPVVLGSAWGTKA